MKLYTFVIFCLMSSFSFAYEVNGRLENMQNNKEIKEGETVRVRLLLWPYESQDDDAFYDLAGKDFLDFFIVSRVSKVVRSKNNEMALEVYMTLLLKKFFTNKQFYIFEHRDLNFPITIVNIIPLKNELKSQDYYIEDEGEGLANKVNYPIILSIFVLLVGIGCIIYFRIIRKSKKEKRKDIVLSEVKTREDFERLFKDKKYLSLQYPQQQIEVEELLSKINSYQYQRDWKEEQFESLELLKNKIIEVAE